MYLISAQIGENIAMSSLSISSVCNLQKEFDFKCNSTLPDVFELKDIYLFDHKLYLLVGSTFDIESK